MEQSCTENLITFIDRLRKRGLVVSVAEAVDVVRLLEPRILQNREDTRTALKCLLAKSENEQAVFDECFDDFFVSREVSIEQLERQRQMNNQRQAEKEEIMEELTFEGQVIELPDDLREVYANMDVEKRDKLKNYLGMSTENQRRSPFTYKFMQRILEQHLRMEDAQYEAEDAAVGSDASGLQFRDISKIGEDEMPRAVNLIQSMVKQLNGSISRSWRRSGKRGRLDFRATFRAGLGTGGLYKLKYKRRRRSRRKLVLLCDVSGSMLKYSEFVIRFIKSMNDVSDLSKVFIFSEELREVSPFVLEDMNSFQSFVKNSGLWGKGTDIAAAVDELMCLRPAVMTGNAVLMIISDTKSVNLTEARRSIQRAAVMAGRTIWLNPIPSHKWLKIASVRSFSDLCEMLDCSTIDELSKACARLLMS